MNKKVLLILLTMFLSIKTSAYDAFVNGIYYNISGTEATVTYKTEDYDSYSGIITIPATVTYGNVEYSVTSIGGAAFAYCNGLTSVIIPNSVTSIGNSAFMECGNLTSVTIPNSVTSIGHEVFEGCSSLTSLNVEAGNTCYDSRENCNAIIETATNTLISGTKNTIIPNSVTSIDELAFSFCYGLTSITIPNSVTSIGTSAFHGCQDLTSVTIPNSVSSIGGGAFNECSSLTSLNVEAGNTYYDSRENCNAIIETATNTLISGTKNTIIPNSVTSIGNSAFGDCSGLASITIPNGVTSIGHNAFRGCHNLTSVTIPNSVISIGSFAFFECGNLTSVSVEAVTPLVITENTFTNITNATLYVPIGSKANYVAASVWKDFKNIIEGNIVSKNVTTAGTLSTLISDAEKNTITVLTLTGQLNGTDLLFIREMAGSNVKGVPTAGTLQYLDLSGATIEAGGDAYIDLDYTYIDLGNNVKLYDFIPDAKTSVANTFGDYLFAGCQQLKSVKTPANLISIGERVFEGSGLTSIDLNSGLETIKYGAFWFTKLSSITIPNTVTAIGANGWIENPFAYNNNLTSISLEEENDRYSMSDGGKLLIDNNNDAVVCALGNEAIPEDITTIGSNAFCNRPELVSYTIPEGVTTLTNPSYPNIGNNTFSQCANLESIVIPEGITVISNSAFKECPKLNNVTIPSTVTRIGDFAFKETGLTKITIPASVTYIGEESFANNQKLATVISLISDPSTITLKANAFAQQSGKIKTLYVPTGTTAAYTTAGWDAYFTNIIDHAILTATSYSRVYGEANPTFGFTDNGGLYSGTPTITCAATATSGVGTYDIVITAGTITDASVQYVNGTLTITKAPLKITAKSYTKKQGEANPEFGVTYEGFKNSETDAVLTTKPTVTCAATKDSPAGTYDITVSGAVAGNYEISYVAGTLTIEAAPMPEPKGTTFDVDTDDSSTKEVKVTFVVKESDGSSTPTVAISDDKDASGSVSIPEAVTHNGVEYKVTEISEGAFQNNTSLTEVKIPASITSIGAKAFAGCKNLQAITINIIVPINLAVISARGFTRTTGDDVFEGVDKETCILYVPEGSVDQYKSAPVWKEFKNILPIKTSTGIQGVVQTDGEPFDVFNLSGQKMKSNATSLEGLPRGIYIVKGKKVIN